MKKPSLQYRPLSANPNHATQENEYPKDIGAIYDDHNGAAPRTPSIRPFAANPEKKKEFLTENVNMGMDQYLSIPFLVG